MVASRGTILGLLGCVLSAVAITVHSEDQDDGRVARRPANLQVLPADIAATSLNRLMKRFEKDLGVSCGYCHVENRDTGKLDYASDENPRKATARLMIAMLEDINDRHLAQLGGDRRYAAAVTCGSCHQGRASPPSFEGRP